MAIELGLSVCTADAEVAPDVVIELPASTESGRIADSRDRSARSLIFLIWLLGEGDRSRFRLLRILCSDKGDIEVGSLAMACWPRRPAV